MHLYNSKKRREDRPQGINTPRIARRIIRCVSGDTLSFTTMVYVPSTREPVRKEDLATTDIYVAVAENRFSPVIWSGSSLDGWIKLDENRPGLVHITVPRTVMGVLRRGAYSFSVVADDGVVRETQLTGNFQIEYEPTGAINEIPYKRSTEGQYPIYLTPETDLAAQDIHRLTYDQLVAAVGTLSRVLIGNEEIRTSLFGEGTYEPTYEEVEHAVHRLSQLIIFDDELRHKIQTVSCDTYDPTYGQLVDRVRTLLETAGRGWEGVPCRPTVV